MKGHLTNSFFWILCFAAPLLLAVSPGFCDQVQTQSERRAPLDYQGAILQPMTGMVFEDKGRNAATLVRFKKRERLFHPIIIKVSRHYQVDPALVKAIILAESEYNPNAISRRGAKGLMQLMPRTARSLGVEDIFDPEHNIKGGVRHFKGLLKKFEGDVKLALAAYNAGSGRVRQYKGIPPFKATKRYIKKVVEYYEIYKQQM